MKTTEEFVNELKLLETSLLKSKNDLDANYNAKKAEIDEELSKVQKSINALTGGDNNGSREIIPLTPERKKVLNRDIEQLIKNGYSAKDTMRKKILYILSGEDDMVVHNIYTTMVDLDDDFRKAVATAPNEDARTKLKSNLKRDISWNCSDMIKHSMIASVTVGNKKAYSLLPDSPRRTKKNVEKT